MEDKIIQCDYCGQSFIWTQDEQHFFAQKGLEAPRRCMICRSLVQEASKDKFRGKSGFEKK